MRRSRVPSVRPSRLAAILLACAVTAYSSESVHAQAVDALDSASSRASLLALIDGSEAGDIGPLRAAVAGMSVPAHRDLAQARLAAAALDLGGTRTAVRRLRHNKRAAVERTVALAIEAGVAFACGDYRLATRDSAAWLDAPPGTDALHKPEEIRQLNAVASALARAPRQRVVRVQPGPVRAWRDKAGLLRADMAVAGRGEEAVLDTGANLSVVTVSAAARLGLRVTGAAAIHSSTRSDLAVRFAVADHLRLAGAELRNVAFLVVDDADLDLPLPGGYQITAIIGFPVFRALGRVSFSPTSFGVASAPSSPGGATLVASGSDLYAGVTVNGVRVPLHLDTGANVTTLGSLFAAAHGEMTEHLETRHSRMAGAGGTTAGIARVLRNPSVGVGTVRVRPDAIEVTDASGYGTLGQDIAMATGGYTVDFRNLTIALDSHDEAAAKDPPSDR